MFAIFEGGFRQFVMCPDRSDHGDGVDLSGSQELRGVHRQLQTRIDFLCALERGGIRVADCSDLAAFETMEIPDYIRAPITVTDNANTQLCRGSRWVARANAIFQGQHEPLSEG